MLSLTLLASELSHATPLTTRDVTRIARICRVPGGYRLTRRNGADVAIRSHQHADEINALMDEVYDDEPTTEIPFTYAERAWFRRPIGGGL